MSPIFLTRFDRVCSSSLLLVSVCFFSLSLISFRHLSVWPILVQFIWNCALRYCECAHSFIGTLFLFLNTLFYFHLSLCQQSSKLFVTFGVWVCVCVCSVQFLLFLLSFQKVRDEEWVSKRIRTLLSCFQYLSFCSNTNCQSKIW